MMARPLHPGRLARFRRHVWMAIALCLAVRSADAALGLHLIDQSPSVAAQEGALLGSVNLRDLGSRQDN